jgi:hypothetical protein
MQGTLFLYLSQAHKCISFHRHPKNNSTRRSNPDIAFFSSLKEGGTEEEHGSWRSSMIKFVQEIH